MVDQLQSIPGCPQSPLVLVSGPTVARDGYDPCNVMLGAAQTTNHVIKKQRESIEAKRFLCVAFVIIFVVLC